MDNDNIRLLTEVEQRAKSNTRRIDRLEERLDKMEIVGTTVAAMQVELSHVLETVQEIKSSIEELQKRPVKWWDKLWLAVLTAVVGFVVAKMLGG